MKNDLLKRTVSGIILAAVLIFCILFSVYSKMLVLAVIALGALYEFIIQTRKMGAEPLYIPAAFLSLLLMEICFLAVIGRGSLSGLLFLVIFVLIRGIVELYRKTEKPILALGAELFGVFYITVPLALLLFLPAKVVLAILVMVWSNDIGAYLIGITFGKYRLFERISPKKSWEGFFGGIICAILAGVMLGHWVFGNALMWGILGLVTAVACVYGDLFESMMKRSAGVKDSGNIIPGHGGFLDRFDALFFAVPLFFVIYILFI